MFLCIRVCTYIYIYIYIGVCGWVCACARHLLGHGPNGPRGYSSIPGLLMNSQAYASDLVTLKPTPLTRPAPRGFDTFKLLPLFPSLNHFSY